MILIGSRGEYLCDLEIAWGLTGEVSGQLRPMIQLALNRGASGIIMVHNHPSGDPRPSADDIAFTRGLRALCTPLELEVVDHLIVASTSIFSMRRANLV